MKRIWTLILAAAALHAAVAPELTLEELVAKSEIIAHARVGRSWTSWDPKRKYIWTHHELQMIDPIRGGAGPVVVSEPGGLLNGIGMRFSGTVEYTPGEEAVVFLYRTPIGYYRATGMSQGKFTIARDQRVRSGARGSGQGRFGAAPLGAFKSRVREIAGRPR